MGMFGIDAALGKHTGFINVSSELLMSDVLELLPQQRIVLELLETVKIDSSVIERCRELKAKGFRLALDDFQYDASYEPLFHLVDFIKLDVMVSNSRRYRGSEEARRGASHSSAGRKSRRRRTIQALQGPGLSLVSGDTSSHAPPFSPQRGQIPIKLHCSVC
jgi:EAL and modified HD-GYP domain-containing signal transduction protein